MNIKHSIWLYLKRNFILSEVWLLSMFVLLFIMMSIHGRNTDNWFQAFLVGIIFIVVMLAVLIGFILLAPKGKQTRLLMRINWCKTRIYRELLWRSQRTYQLCWQFFYCLWQANEDNRNALTFYLMHSKGQGTIIPKGKAGEGFVDFIHKIKEKYNI